MEEVWRAYADEWVKYSNVIWQIGLRGIGDRPMWLADPDTPQSDAERGELIFFETERKPQNTYGVYYHHQLWGSGPHLAQIVPPAQTYKVIGEAVSKGDTAYCIMNVSNIREFQLGIATSSAMLWDYDSFRPTAFENSWFEQHYGRNASQVAKAYAAYFSSFELNEAGKTLALMDGQTRGLGLGILNQIKKQVEDPAGYAAEQKRKQQQSAESTWGSKALGDMRGGYSERDQQLTAVQRQISGFAKADSLAASILPDLKDEEKAFFITNFISHVKIMLGLERWLENVILAQEAIEDDRRVYPKGDRSHQANRNRTETEHPDYQVETLVSGR